jgi:hypothetical protein
MGLAPAGVPCTERRPERRLRGYPPKARCRRWAVVGARRRIAAMAADHPVRRSREALRMSLIVVSARVASTHPVAKYPGWRLSKEVLESMAERLAAGEIPMLFDHDARNPIEARCLDTKVVSLEGGNAALETTFEIEADAWAQIQQRFADAGVPGGFSFTATAPQAAPASGRDAIVTLAADAAAWTDEDRVEAGELLDAVIPTQTDRLFQYSAVDLATIYLILRDVGLGVLGNAVYDAL